MIIEVRFRDISFEEAKQCFSDARYIAGGSAEHWETKLRGGFINIETPGFEPTGPAFICGGPVFKIAGWPRDPQGKSYCVCPHIAEIGD